MLLNELPAYAIIIFVGVSLTSLNVGLQLFQRNDIYRPVYLMSIFIGIVFVSSLLMSFWYIISEDFSFKIYAVLIAFMGSNGLLYFLFLLLGFDQSRAMLKEDFLPKF